MIGWKSRRAAAELRRGRNPRDRWNVGSPNDFVKTPGSRKFGSSMRGHDFPKYTWDDRDHLECLSYKSVTQASANYSAWTARVIRFARKYRTFVNYKIEFRHYRFSRTKARFLTNNPSPLSSFRWWGGRESAFLRLPRFSPIGIPLLSDSEFHLPKSARKKHGVSAGGMPAFDIKESSAFAEDRPPRQVYRGFSVTSRHSRIISRKKSSSKVFTGRLSRFFMFLRSCVATLFTLTFSPPLIVRELNPCAEERWKEK